MESKVKEKELKAANGGMMLVGILFGLIACIALIVLIAVVVGNEDSALNLLVLLPMLAALVLCVMFAGFKVVNPNEAYVLTFFGKYYGSLKKPGFYWVNPFTTAINPAGNVAGIGPRKISVKAMTLNNEKQKVNDEDGNPIEIGVVVIWRISDTAKAVFNVDNYYSFVSTQCDAAIRQVARQFPYDVADGGNEKTLRGSSQEIADVLKQELQERVNMAGIEVMDARIAHLAYAPEIAAAMLQRQQAAAIIAARQKIVDGAVSMVDMALKKLSKEQIVELDEERKAQMVSNLLVILCGNKDAQPIVNSGSIY